MPIAGDTPEAVLWASFDFLDVQVPLMEGSLAPPRGRYPGTFFRANKRNLAKFDKEKEKRIPVRNIACAPRSVRRRSSTPCPTTTRRSGSRRSARPSSSGTATTRGRKS